MKIGLLAVDSKHPNLALMKVSAYYKANNHSVEWYNNFENYDIVFASKIFSFTPDFMEYIHADKVYKGGSGYDIKSTLPKEIDNCTPDYSIYPQIDNKTAYGFLTRGCIRNCEWCIVPKKEGNVSIYRDIEQIATDNRNNIILMDNNFLASGDYATEQLQKIISLDLRVDFNQGLDARLVTEQNAKLLAKVKWIKCIRFASDTPNEIKDVDKAIRLLKKNGFSKQVFIYCLLQKDVRECLDRLNYWKIMEKEYGIQICPFAQPYKELEKKSQKIPQWQKDMARWCNRKWLFKTTSFLEYSQRKNFKCKEYLIN